jgi:hypothetical protein
LTVSFEQIITVMAALLFAMSGAIGAMFRWMLAKFNELEKTLAECRKDKSDAAVKMANLEGRMEELLRHNPADLVTLISETVTKALRGEAIK